MGRDIFSNVARIFFIYNIPQYHWATFEVEPTALNQQYFDSLWDTIESNPDHVKTSKAIHQWMLNYHEATMGHKHPKARRWTKGIVTDDHNVLRNAVSESNDDMYYHSPDGKTSTTDTAIESKPDALQSITSDYYTSIGPLQARVKMVSPSIVNGYETCSDLESDITEALKLYMEEFIMNEAVIYEVYATCDPENDNWYTDLYGDD